MSLSAIEEANRRRSFAIISHPDAGKTTLTENLLLAGGAIRMAGQVAARGERRRTTSDWMKIERDRGISVSSSVMTFEYDDKVFNLLDTPGHEDFSEDTYRTLTAADSAIMVLDAAKGIEPQTLKLFEVCRLRDIPIVTFINKMDREAQDPFQLLDDVASQLALDPVPLYWPAGSGERFGGMVDLSNNDFAIYEKRAADEEQKIGAAPRTPFNGNEVRQILDDYVFDETVENAELAKEGFGKFDPQSYLEGHMTPVVFGSALRHFGVAELLDVLAAYAPAPRPQKAALKGVETPITVEHPKVSGFVFKVQANMDPNHRDRVAFFRQCSGKFQRGMKLKTANGKAMNIHNPMMFLAQDREIADIAYAGDVIGIPNHGQLRVGDSLSESGDIVFEGIPNFAPELLRRARVTDPMKAKHLRKALEGLAEEGITQLFKPALGADMIVGAVGMLQFDVMVERIRAEYNLDVVFEQTAYNVARWVGVKEGQDKKLIADFLDKNKSAAAEDLDGAVVVLAKNTWEVGYMEEKNPDLRFLNTKERLA